MWPTQMIRFLCLLASISAAENEVIYQNEFAVHIPGGSRNLDLVDNIALNHGFINKGQIGALNDHFLFKHSHVHKRSLDKSNLHYDLLQKDNRVHWFEQQVELKRSKRDYKILIPTDPLFKSQWFLFHGAADGSDMNVIPAWNMGYTGKNVVVTILDDGIQYNHPDIKRNYDPLASMDANDDDDDPMPTDNGDNKHGTRCAGEVAAEAFNDLCGAGIAFNASIGGVRMLDGVVNDVVEAKALSFSPQHIDIYSASWGPEDDGKTVDGPGPLAKRAFVQGISEGRGGKGSIFVWASGNGGRKADNCNCDGYTNSVYTLSISSASQGGRKPWYLEECSSTLATTYSSGTPSQDATIVTIDQDGQLRPDKLCTASHTGTSASAPIAAAICALALEANPSLTWRDIQHLVVLSSNPEPLLIENGWQLNGVSRMYSHKFGYGLMDATAMVTLAKVWSGAGEQIICETENVEAYLDISSDPELVTRSVLKTNSCGKDGKLVNYLEHVQCQISLQYYPRGALHILLTSPSGTKSSLLLPRPRDDSEEGFNDWPFLSVHFWGERPNGTWTLEINRHPNVGENIEQQDGLLKSWKLIFYGTSKNPLDQPTVAATLASSKTQQAQGNYYEMEDFEAIEDKGAQIANETKNTNNITNCHKECKEGCTGPASSQCFDCRSFRFKGVCVATCPRGTYATVENTCKTCHRLCSTCFGGRKEQCLSCIQGYILQRDRGICVPNCGIGYRRLLGTNECVACPEHCLECQSLENFRSICLKCKQGLLMQSDDDVCLDSCPEGYFPDWKNFVCEKCHSKCETCIGPLATQCARCSNNTFFYERKCVTKCPTGYTANIKIKECVPCLPGCADCKPNLKCSQCLPHWSMSDDGTCIPSANEKCPSGTFADPSGSCRSCDYTCGQCKGGTKDKCISCYGGHLLHINSCIDQCPPTTFEIDGVCHHCPHACQECSSREKCNTCQKGYVLSANQTCVTTCQKGEYGNTGSCKPCHPTCQSCTGPDSNQCLVCKDDLLLTEGECQENCPARYFADKNKMICYPCHEACQTCTHFGAEKCTSCRGGDKFLNGFCLACKQGSYYSNDTNRCHSCHSSCASCSGPNSQNCTSCPVPFHLDPSNNTCVPCCAEKQEHSCCTCTLDKSQCILPISKSFAHKRSFHEEVHSPTKAAFFSILLLSLAAMTTVFVLRSFSRYLRRNTRLMMMRSSRGPLSGYRPLSKVNKDTFVQPQNQMKGEQDDNEDDEEEDLCIL